MALEVYSSIKTKQLRGGMTTVREKSLLSPGSFSEVQNLRSRHPGFIKRLGQRELNGTADGTNRVLSLYQFDKSRVTDSHFFSQMSDGDLLEYSGTLPTTTSGIFGGAVHDGSTNQICASYGNINDILIYSNGQDQHQIYGGDGSYVEKFIVYNGTEEIPDLPTLGKDATDEIMDSDTTRYADLSSLSTVSSGGYDCWFIRTQFPITSLSYKLASFNTTSGTAEVSYWSTDSAWTSVSGLADTTVSGGCTLIQDGAWSWDTPTDEMEKYQYASNGFWYRCGLATGATDATTHVYSTTFGSNFQNIRNVWDGVPQDCVEAQVYDGDVYFIYGSTDVSVSEMGNTWEVYMGCQDPSLGFYIDPGSVPNEDTGTSIDELYYWNGTAWRGVVADDGNTLHDDTNGMTEPGWLYFPKTTQDPEPIQFRSGGYYAYWYYYTITTTSGVTEDTNIGIQFAPYFDIDQFGKSRTNCIWKDRALYTFDKWSEYIYVSRNNAPLVLNGGDYGTLEAGDGRANAVVAMRKFHNELLVWQEEVGGDGGCLTLFEGYSPLTFGKLVLSSKIGAMNNNAVEVVDGVMTATATDEKIKTLAFFLSRYGVGVTDGRIISMISDDIGNYFDPTQDECIRRGYEKKMWLKHDSAFNILRIGLVTGPTATECNTFFVFDLVDKCFYKDVYGQNLSCMCEIGATTGQAPVLQYGGGTDDGKIYQLNYGKNDVSSPITSHLQQEFNGLGELIQLRELDVVVKAQSDDQLLLEIKNNGITEVNKSFSQQPNRSDQEIRRLREHFNVMGEHISVKLSNNSMFGDMYLQSLGVLIRGWQRV